MNSKNRGGPYSLHARNHRKIQKKFSNFSDHKSTKIRPKNFFFVKLLCNIKMPSKSSVGREQAILSENHCFLVIFGHRNLSKFFEILLKISAHKSTKSRSKNFFFVKQLCNIEMPSKSSEGPVRSFFLKKPCFRAVAASKSIFEFLPKNGYFSILILS